MGWAPIRPSALVLLVIASTACGAHPLASATPIRASTPIPATITVSVSSAPTATPSLPPIDEAAVLATRLRLLEGRIRDLRTRYVQLSVLARTQQDAYQELILHPSLLPRVLASLPPDVQDVVNANVSAALQIRELNGLRSELPHWRIVEPPQPGVLLSDYREAQARYGIPWEYLAAINLIETSMGRIQGTSIAGALGPMQFMPATWAHYGQGGNVNDPHDAILAAGRYLQAHGGPGDMARAVFAYNPSDLYVRAVTLYAGVMQADPRAFFGYYFWQVYVPTTKGDVLLPQGFSN